MRKPRKRYAHLDNIFDTTLLKFRMLGVRNGSVESFDKCISMMNKFRSCSLYLMIVQIMTETEPEDNRFLERSEADELKCD